MIMLDEAVGNTACAMELSGLDDNMIFVVASVSFGVLLKTVGLLVTTCLLSRPFVIAPLLRTTAAGLNSQGPMRRNEVLRAA